MTAETDTTAANDGFSSHWIINDDRNLRPRSSLRGLSIQFEPPYNVKPKRAESGTECLRIPNGVCLHGRQQQDRG